MLKTTIYRVSLKKKASIESRGKVKREILKYVWWSLCLNIFTSSQEIRDF